MKNKNKIILLPVAILFLLGGCGKIGSNTIPDVTEQAEADTASKEQIDVDNTSKEQIENETEETTSGEAEDHGYYDLTGKSNEEFINECLGDGAYDWGPYASYVNPEGELQMEVYHDEDSVLWCVIRYAVDEDECTYGLLIDADADGYEVDDIYEEGIDELISPEDWIAENRVWLIENPEAEYSYDEAGRLLSYRVTGDLNLTTYGRGILESEFLYKINYEYYDNGMVKKSYSHNLDYFGSCLHYYEKIYDETGRVLYDYEKTPLGVECYWIYDDKSDIPRYRIAFYDGANARMYSPRLAIYVGAQDTSDTYTDLGANGRSDFIDACMGESKE